MSKKQENMTRLWWTISLFVLLFVAITVMPVAAENPWSNYQTIYIKPENGIRFDKMSNGSYYFKLQGGGLNALHISSNPIALPKGDVNETTVTSGTFWITDTGGRGFHDDAILLISVNGTVNSNFAVSITSNGYNWTPTGALNQIPTLDQVKYNASAVNNVMFTSANFTKMGGANPIETYWRPSTQATFPVFNNQDMDDLDTINDFKFIPVDLKVGVLGTGTNASKLGYYFNLTDYGAARIDYVITGKNAGNVVAFNAYGWCNQSNQGQGVSWTNNVNSTGYYGNDVYSGYMVY